MAAIRQGAFIEPVELALRIGGPDMVGHGLGKGQELRFTFLTCGIGFVRDGDIDAFHEDAVDGAGRIAQGLEDEIQDARLGRRTGRALQQHRHGPSDKGFARAKHIVEQGGKALFLDLGQRLAHGLADDVAMADQLVVGRVGQFEAMLRPAQDRCEAGRLGEHLLQAGNLAPLEFAGLDFGKSTGQLARHQPGKALDLRVTGTIGIEAQRQHPHGPALPRLGDGNQQHFARWNRPRARWQLVIAQRDAGRAGQGRSLGLEDLQQRLCPGIGIGAGDRLPRVQQVDQTEGEIAAIFAQRLQGRRSHVVTTARADQFAGQGAERA
jgi:hypothetical protein